MSKETIQVQVEKELSDYIEALQFEVRARESIIKSILTSPDCEINKELLNYDVASELLYSTRKIFTK